VTGIIYYTTLEITDSVDLIEQAAATLDQEVLIFPFFDSTTASLIALDPATGEETVLHSGDGYAYARVTESNTGTLLFSRVESNAELQAAVEENILTAENWRDFLPTVDVLQITSGSEATILLADAAQYTAAH
jgi:hypothetical protein